jgi:uncharacterized protein (TIGR03066 family)
MRVLLGIGLMLGVACAVAAADETIDVKKLIGKWEPKDTDKAGKFVVEFGKDGKVGVSGSVGGTEISAKGTYKVDGNKLIMKMEFMGKEKSMTRIVSKLTDTELVSKQEGSEKEDTMVRVKAKKDK